MINQDDTNKYREVRERLISFICGITWTLGFKLSVKGLKKNPNLVSTQALMPEFQIQEYFYLSLF